MGVETALLATTVIGTGISAYSQYREGQDAKEASKYNADIARQSAQMSEESGALDASRVREQGRRLRGTQKATYGASGVELTGSPLDAMIYSASESELDANIVEYNAKVKGMGYMSQAAYDERLGDIYARSGTMKAAGALLTSAAQLGTQYYTPKTPKTPKQDKGY